LTNNPVLSAYFAHYRRWKTSKSWSLKQQRSPRCGKIETRNRQAVKLVFRAIHRPMFAKGLKRKRAKTKAA
jgi:hypothetical protein